MKKITCFILVLAFSPIVFAKSSITIDGKNHKCKGTLSITQGAVLCDGQPVEKISKSWWVSETETKCGNEQVVKHENGGGTKSVLANVFKGALLEEDSIVCGKSRIDPAAKIKGKSKISGSVRVLGGSTIENSILDGAVEVQTSNLKDAHMSGTSSARTSQIESSSVLGSSKVTSAKIKEGTVLEGTVEVKNSEIIASTISGATFILDNSTIQGSTLQGAMKLQHVKFDACEFMGAIQFKSQTCKNNQLKF